MKLSIKYLSLFLIIALTFGLLILSSNNIKEEVPINVNEDLQPTAPTEIGQNEYRLYVVNSFEDMQKGLARFDRIERNQGMLFIFETPGRYSFFMKDMKFDIDIIFLNETSQVISIFQNVKKDSYRGPFDYEAYKPDSPAKFVIELNAGEVLQNKLKIGDKVNFSIPTEMLK